MSQTEDSTRAMVARLLQVYPMLLVQELYSGIRVEHLSPFDGETSLKKRSRVLWVQPGASWDTVTVQVGAFALSVGLLPIFAQL